MTIVTNAWSTYSAIGNREDLTDIIYDISPTETPFMSNAGRVSATSKYHEWQTDSLASAAANAQLEGDAIAGRALAATVRLKNPCQVSYKAFSITGTQEASDSAGRASETSYQMAKAGKELKRDMEYTLTQNQASSAGGTGTARTLAGVESWIASNGTELGTGATTVGFVTSSGLLASPTDGSSAVTLTEGHLKLAIQEAWAAGGNPEVIMVGGTQKTVVSGFSGIATLFQNTSGNQGTIIGGADVYVSDFGKHTIVPNRFQRNATVLVLDMMYWAVAFLRPIHSFPLAKTGDADSSVVLAEFTLESRNEAASAKVAGCA
jgi:hypothetical protein